MKRHCDHQQQPRQRLCDYDCCDADADGQLPASVAA